MSVVTQIDTGGSRFLHHATLFTTFVGTTPRAGVGDDVNQRVVGTRHKRGFDFKRWAKASVAMSVPMNGSAWYWGKNSGLQK